MIMNKTLLALALIPLAGKKFTNGIIDDKPPTFTQKRKQEKLRAKQRKKNR